PSVESGRATTSTSSRLLRGNLAANVQRKLAPLSAVVGVKSRRLRVALAVPRHLRADQLQTVAVVISHPEPLEDEFLFELLPTHLDLIPVHERLLPPAPWLNSLRRYDHGGCGVVATILANATRLLTSATRFSSRHHIHPDARRQLA